MEIKLKTELLRNTPVFRSLSEPLLMSILQAPENKIEEYAPKQLIVRESETGECMYIILDGAVEVLIRAEASGRDIAIATLRAGDFFGERSLMPGSTGRRNATVRAIYQTRVFRIDKKYVLLSVKRDDFHLDEDEEVTILNPATYKQASKPAAPATSAATPPSPSLPSQPSDEVLATVMKLRLFKSLNRDELFSIHDWTEIVTAGPGEFIIKESQIGQAMYVVLDGEVEIFTLDHDGKIVPLAKMKNGDYFGEQALMPDSNGKRNAFARSEKLSRLIRIPKEYFRLVLNRDSELYKELSKVHEAQKQKMREVKKA